MAKSIREQHDERVAAGIAALERAARDAASEEQRALLEQAATDLARSAVKRATLREKRKRSEQRWKQKWAEREARVTTSVPAAENSFPITIERTDEVADFTNHMISWARVWKGTTRKGTRIALAVCAVAIENEESREALSDPGIHGDLEQWLASSTGGTVPCDIKDDLDADDLTRL